MGTRFVITGLMFLSLALILAACNVSNLINSGPAEETDAEESTDEEDAAKAAADEEAAPADEEAADGEQEAGAVTPSDGKNEIEFTRINWMFGAPDRQPEPGVWLYTEDDHPDQYADTFDFTENDYLLWQIGDEKYKGYVLRTARLIEEDSDVVKIVVRIHDEPDSDQAKEDDKMPRQYLKVPKGALEGKSFTIETEDGEPLSLE